MANHQTSTPVEINNMAEGSPDKGEEREPATPLHTGVMPVVEAEKISITPSETGLVNAVDIAEGTDEDDAQDASLTTQETHESKAKPEPKTEETPTSSTNPKTVFIVEDTAELIEVMDATLSRLGFQVTSETHGAKAIETIKTITPDVILLDIGLPDMTGWKILDAIKARYKALQATDATVKTPPIIVITAYDDPANRLVGKLQGIFSYLIKPFTPDEVERVVRDALGMDEDKSKTGDATK